MITVFSKEWFKKYNKWIVALAKLPIIGEWIFCFKKYGHYFDKKNLLEVQPNAVVEDMKLMWTKCVRIKGQWVAYDCTNKLHNRLIKKECKEKLLPTRRNHYFVRNEYALRLQKVFYPIWITFHIWDIITRPIPQLNLGFDTLTVYPDAHPESTSVDGTLYREGLDVTLSQLRARTDGSSLGDASPNSAVYLATSNTSGNFSACYRTLQFFDTAGLTSSATISAAIESIYIKTHINGIADFAADVHIAQGNAASNTALVGADYDQTNHGTTSFGAALFSGMSNNSYSDVTLNASGISSISKTSITKHSLQQKADINNSFTGTWAASKMMSVIWNSSDAGSNKPKLVITYTLPAVGPANVKTYKGLASASVKTCKGLAIASVKSKKGLA